MIFYEDFVPCKHPIVYRMLGAWLQPFFGPLPLPGVKKEEIQAIRYVATGAEIPVSTSWVHSDYPTMAFADLGEDPVLPDGVDTVIDVILKK